jgi:hypothetical protein
MRSLLCLDAMPFGHTQLTKPSFAVLLALESEPQVMHRNVTHAFHLKYPNAFIVAPVLQLLQPVGELRGHPPDLIWRS